MIVDIDITHYYKKYINDASNDIEKYTVTYNTNKQVKNKAREYLINKLEFIKEHLNIRLRDYKNTWILSKYDESENLYKVAYNKLVANITGESRIVLIQIIRYCKTLQLCEDSLTSIELAKTRSTLTFKQYQEYVTKYYRYGVHKCCLEGYSYKFAEGLGNLMINFWKYTTQPSETYVDFPATNKKKKEILEAGLKLYDEKEAEIYKIRGLKYDGIKYVQYKTNKEFYNIEVNGNIRYPNGSLIFKHANYINNKLRNISVEDIAKSCNTMEEVYDLKVGLRHKLLIALEKDPTIYINYIRNAEQCKYKRGAHNSQNRQRLQS